MGVCSSKPIKASTKPKTEDQSIFNPFYRSKDLFNPMPVDEVYAFSPQILGSGSFGTVKKATHRSSFVQRAVKIIHKRKASTSLVDRIREEIAILMKLDHPNILKIFEYFEDSENLYIIMEYLEGGELFRSWDSERATENDLAWIMHQILSALRYCHLLNIAHRDIKPQNIVYVTGKDQIVKLIDFGTSKESKGSSFKGHSGTVSFFFNRSLFIWPQKYFWENMVQNAIFGLAGSSCTSWLRNSLLSRSLRTLKSSAVSSETLTPKLLLAKWGCLLKAVLSFPSFFARTSISVIPRSRL